MFTYAPIHLLTHAPRPIGAPVNPPALRLLEPAPGPKLAGSSTKRGPFAHAPDCLAVLIPAQNVTEKYREFPEFSEPERGLIESEPLPDRMEITIDLGTMDTELETMLAELWPPGFDLESYLDGVEAEAELLRIEAEDILARMVRSHEKATRKP